MNKVKFGLSNCVIAPITDLSNYTYGTPIPVPGAVNLSLTPAGDTNDMYADNTIYFSSTANQGYEGDLEIALISDEIRNKILGETIDSNGALIESANDKPVNFAFGFQIEGDAKATRYWYYNCSLTRPANNAQTNEASITPQTDTLNMKAMPRLTDKKTRAKLVRTEENAAVYDAFFSSVYESETSE